VSICDQKLDAIAKNYKDKAFFQEFYEEGFQLRDNYINLIKAKKEQLATANTMSEAEIEIAMEKERIAVEKANMALREAELKAKEEAAENEKKAKESELAAAQEKQRLAAEAELNKTRNIRYTWKHELYDIKAVPLEWLTLDEEKVKAYIKANKDKLVDGDIVDGVKFIKNMSVAS